MLTKSILLAALAMVSSAVCADEDAVKLDFHGAGWLQTGRVGSSFATPGEGNAYRLNWVGQSGGLLAVHSAIDEHWEGSLGMGTVLVQLARGARLQSNKWYPFWVSWVDEADLSYNAKLGEGNAFKETIGSFHYGYNPDIKNFGQYLMHGYVYPGTIVTSLTGPLGVNQNLSGSLSSFKFGSLQDDFIVNIETDDKPLYDISIADIVSYKIGKGIEIGAGANLYRLIPSNSKATSPGKDCNEALLGPYASQHQPNPCFLLDTLARDASGNPTQVDTITGSLAGTKLMGRLRIDPKALFGMEGGVLGANDLVLYTEFALLGIKNYPQFYEKRLRRVPVMVGFNLPGFNLFDWSVEVEYYASKNSQNNLAAQNGSWIPVVDDSRINDKRDDWKYSVNISKVIGGHSILMGQVANDDLRMGGNHDDATGKQAMRTPTDWYWTTKIAYFF